MVRTSARPASPWRLIPFYAVSLSFGLQALFSNAGQTEPYRLHLSINALRATLSVYGPWLLVAAPAILVRDRRTWIAVALLATSVTILLLPGRLFSVYLYLPLTGAAVAVAVLVTRWRAPLVVIALIAWLLWSYSLLRQYRGTEIREARQRRAYVTNLFRHTATLSASRTFLYDAKPAHMDPWGVEGALRLAGAPYGAIVQALDVSAGLPRRIDHGTVVVCWDAAAQRTTVAKLRAQEPAPLYIDVSNPAALPHLLEGFSQLDNGYRPIRGCARLRLALSPNSRTLHVAWRVDGITAPEEITLAIDGEWLGGFPCRRAGPHASYWPVRRNPSDSVIVEIATAGELSISVRSIGFR